MRSMANGRSPSRTKRDLGRDSGGFVALPWSVLDCVGYARLSHPARSMLMEFARQFVRDNNGRLLASRKYLGPRRWRSTDVIKRAKDELIAAGFIFETVIGQLPNKASWYAVTWRDLDRIAGYDAGAEQLFRRSAYLLAGSGDLTTVPLKKRDQARAKGRFVRPCHGLDSAPIVPSHGLETLPLAPSHGAIRTTFDTSPRPSHGHHLEKPSTATESNPAESISLRWRPFNPSQPTGRIPTINRLGYLWVLARQLKSRQRLAE